MEEWKNINGLKYYQISNYGRIKSLPRYKRPKEKILAQRTTKRGYKIVTILKKSYKIHRLVALHFIDNVEQKPQVNHIDGNKTNNVVSNLEWCTNLENRQHGISLGLFENCMKKLYEKNIGETHPRAKLKEVQVIEIRNKYATKNYTLKQLSIEYNISVMNCSNIINRKLWTNI